MANENDKLTVAPFSVGEIIYYSRFSPYLTVQVAVQLNGVPHNLCVAFNNIGVSTAQHSITMASDCCATVISKKYTCLQCNKPVKIGGRSAQSWTCPTSRRVAPVFGKLDAMTEMLTDLLRLPPYEGLVTCAPIAAELRAVYEFILSTESKLTYGTNARGLWVDVEKFGFTY